MSWQEIKVFSVGIYSLGVFLQYKDVVSEVMQSYCFQITLINLLFDKYIRISATCKVKM